MKLFMKTGSKIFTIVALCLIVFSGLWFFKDKLIKPKLSPDEQLRAEYLARKKAEARELIVGQSLESTPPENEASNFYAVRLAAGDYIRLSVDELPKPYNSASVVMVLLDPQDKVIAVSDEQFRVQNISAVAETAGLYHVRVHRYNGIKPPHRITLVEQRQANEQDRIRAAAYRALTTAYQIQDGDLTSKELAAKALLKYDEALRLVRSINEPREEAFILSLIGRVYDWQKNFDLGKDYSRQALTIYRTIQDHEGERYIVSFLGTYTDDKQLAIEYNRRAAELAGETGDLISEVDALERIARIYEAAQTSEETAQALEAYNAALTKQKALTAQLIGESNAANPASSHILPSKRVEAEILLKIGEMQNRLGQTAKALESCRQALDLARESKDIVVESNVIKMIDQIKSVKKR